jgi:putative nucleotidyltransferase with HDIG domain
VTTISAIGVRARTWRQQEWTLAAPQVYLGCVIAAGLYVLATSLCSMAAAPPDLRCAALCLLTVAGAQLMLRMPEVPVSFSISDIFTFTTALMFGPSAGAVVVAVEAAVLSMRLVQSNRSLTRYLFNVSATAIAMFLSARLFFALSRTAPLAADPSAIIGHVGALATFAVVYFALNTAFVAIAVALAGRRSPWQVWHGHFMSLWPGYVGGASAAGMGLFLVSTQHGDLRVLVFVVPIPFIVYVTFRTAVARMQDDVAHLTRINSMYLATIETLAQAVDARDQVTHDHLRRVQTNAMLLARELKIEDELELRALEAAALLHDMGKLAVPEHILNKPDKLTAAEFEVMKLHSTIGADILSPIEFPFPVVPIVRHHHENWDGSGYPDGLRGDQIPIGARILAVVDCFDALTSDRPYRRAFPPDRALGLILERSGVMYDPAVVTALLRIKDGISVEPAAASDVQSAAVVERFAHARQAVRTDEAGAGISAVTVHMAGRLGQAVGRHRDIGALCDELGDQLARQVPGLTMVIYQYDSQLGALFARAAAGVHKAAVEGLTIGMGLRLTGWVGAHRTTIVNSEAALDLGNLAAQLRPVPQLCLSTPLIAEDRLAGVLTVYSTLDRPFASTDVALFEMLAALLAPLVHSDARDRSEGSGGPTETDTVPASVRTRTPART